MKIRVRALGLALGLVVGVGYFVAILISLFLGGGITFGHIQPLFGPWVSRSIPGAFLGFVWGLVYGFIGGALIAWLYNFFHQLLYKSAPAK